MQNSQRIIAVVGLSKNVGKTTLLNWLIKNLAEKKHSATFGIITTGRDGETLDLVGGHAKPQVFVPAGTFFSTLPQVIQKDATSLEVIKKLPFQAGGERLWLVQARRNLHSEIVGPATASQQIFLAKEILRLGAGQVFIDGSLDRKSIALSSEIDALIVVAGAEAGTLSELKTELTKLQMLAKLPRCKNALPHLQNISYCVDKKIQTTALKSILHQEAALLALPRITEAAWIYFPTAFTERNYEKIASVLGNSRFIFAHPLHIQLSAAQLEKIFVQTAVLNKIKIDAIALNSYSAKGNHLDSELLRTEIRQHFPQLPIIDVTEIMEQTFRG